MQYHHLPNKEDKQTKVHWPIRTIHVDQGQFHITNSHLEKAAEVGMLALCVTFISESARFMRSSAAKGK